MFQKLLKKDYFILKQGLPIMHLQRFGKINPIIIKVIFGPWVVLYMKWLLKNHLLMVRIWILYIRKFKKDLMKIFLSIIQKLYNNLSVCVYK